MLELLEKVYFNLWYRCIALHLIYFFPLEDNKQWWERPIPQQDSKNIWYSKPNSVNVEMTSYGLLSILEAGLYSEALPILKWLLNQRNEFGGFQSTQDTFVGLKALAQYAEKFSSNFNNVQISLKYNEGTESRINVNSNNALIQQTYEVIGCIFPQQQYSRFSNRNKILIFLFSYQIMCV